MASQENASKTTEEKSILDMEKPVVPMAYALVVGMDAEQMLGDWLKVNAPEVIHDLWNESNVLRCYVTELEENHGEVSVGSNEDVTESILRLAQIADELGARFGTFADYQPQQQASQ